MNSFPRARFGAAVAVAFICGLIFASGFADGSTNKWRDQATALPLVAFYGWGDLTVHTGEQLWVVFSSGTSTQLLIANVRVDDYETAAYQLARQA